MPPLFSTFHLLCFSTVSLSSCFHHPFHSLWLTSLSIFFLSSSPTFLSVFIFLLSFLVFLCLPFLLSSLFPFSFDPTPQDLSLSLPSFLLPSYWLGFHSLPFTFLPFFPFLSVRTLHRLPPSLSSRFPPPPFHLDLHSPPHSYDLFRLSFLTLPPPPLSFPISV